MTLASTIPSNRCRERNFQSALIPLSTKVTRARRVFVHFTQSRIRVISQIPAGRPLFPVRINSAIPVTFDQGFPRAESIYRCPANAPVLFPAARVSREVCSLKIELLCALPDPVLSTEHKRQIRVAIKSRHRDRQSG